MVKCQIHFMLSYLSTALRKRGVCVTDRRSPKYRTAILTEETTVLESSQRSSKWISKKRTALFHCELATPQDRVALQPWRLVVVMAVVLSLLSW